jgi:hypothetical protein
MIGTRSALLAASLLAAAPAVAAQPDGGHYVWVPPGATAIVVPAAPATPIDFPVARMVAQQEALMNRMFADMDSLMATAFRAPDQMIRSVMQGMPQVAPGSGIVVTSVTTGRGTCTQTITYGYPGNGGQPVTRVSSSGNACGAIGSSMPTEVTQPAPGPRPNVPTPMAPRHERVWTVGYPPHPLKGAAPRT